MPVKETHYPNLLIISGTSARSGKTTLACRIIEKIRDSEPVAIKVSPHFHAGSPGLFTVEEGPGFAVYEETDAGTDKDTSRMLKAGAARVFLILAWDYDSETVFKKLLKKIPGKQPIICESPTIRKYFDPGMFIIMSSGNTDERQDVKELRRFPHLELTLNDLSNKEIPVKFKDGRWRCKNKD